MVFFNCGTCGESMRKSQVEKHYKFKCRNCECLSCVDCGKEFWGEEYTQHTKCISEDEKYGGKDYKPKPNANKGERKQEEWTEQVQNAINKCKSNPKLRGLLVKLKDYSNIPRKKAKFENFVKNSLRIHANMATQMWDAIAAEIDLSAKRNSESQDNTASDAAKENPNSAESNDNDDISATQNGVDKKKLSKRERKEERRKNKHKEEKKDKSKKVQVENDECVQENGVSEVKKKKKKRKHEEVENESETRAENESETSGIENESSEVKKKKKKRKHQEMDSEEKSETEAMKGKKRKKNKENVEEPVNKKAKSDGSSLDDSSATQATEENEAQPEVLERQKFKWEKAICQVLRKSDDNELPLKKLRKKVLAEYYACHPNDHLTEEQVLVKFNKKINKNSKLKVHKERVKLIS